MPYGLTRARSRGGRAYAYGRSRTRARPRRSNARIARHRNPRGHPASGQYYTVRVPLRRGRGSLLRSMAKRRATPNQRRMQFGATLYTQAAKLNRAGYRDRSRKARKKGLRPRYALTRRRIRRNPPSRGYTALLREVRRLANPKKKRRKVRYRKATRYVPRRGKGKRGKYRGGRFLPTFRANRRPKRRRLRRRRNDFLVLSNPRRRRRRLRRKRNDFLLRRNPARRRRSLRRRRNPGGIRGMTPWVQKGAYATGGLAGYLALSGVTARFLPATGIRVVDSFLHSVAPGVLAGVVAQQLTKRVAVLRRGQESIYIGIALGALVRLLYSLAPGAASRALPGMSGIGAYHGYASNPVGYAATSGAGGYGGESYGGIARAFRNSLGAGAQGQGRGVAGLGDFLMTPGGGSGAGQQLAGMGAFGDHLETGAPTSSMGSETF